MSEMVLFDGSSEFDRNGGRDMRKCGCPHHHHTPPSSSSYSSVTICFDTETRTGLRNGLNRNGTYNFASGAVKRRPRKPPSYVHHTTHRIVLRFRRDIDVVFMAWPFYCTRLTDGRCDGGPLHIHAIDDPPIKPFAWSAHFYWVKIGNRGWPQECVIFFCFFFLFFIYFPQFCLTKTLHLHQIFSILFLFPSFN